MRHNLSRPVTAWSGMLVAFALALATVASCAKSAPPIQPADLIQIDELAGTLADSTVSQPILLHVGFASLYRSGHIPGSRYVGAGSKPDGIAALKQALAALPVDQPVVLYCGCCPWTDCPNVRPAFQAAKESGHTNVRVLYINGNFERDWIAKGLPSVEGDQ